MIPKELQDLISGGENLTVEFKKSTKEITKDVYEAVCSFSNREGGHIFLGVKDNGEILGIEPNCVERMKRTLSIQSITAVRCTLRFIYRLKNTNWTER